MPLTRISDGILLFGSDSVGFAVGEIERSRGYCNVSQRLDVLIIRTVVTAPCHHSLRPSGHCPGPTHHKPIVPNQLMSLMLDFADSSSTLRTWNGGSLRAALEESKLDPSS